MSRELRVFELDAAGTVGPQEHPESQERDEDRDAGTSGAECHKGAGTEDAAGREKHEAFVHLLVVRPAPDEED